MQSTQSSYFLVTKWCRENLLLCMHSEVVTLHEVSSPVQGVILHTEVVSGEVASRVAEVVELVPQDSVTAWRCGDDCHLH